MSTIVAVGDARPGGSIRRALEGAVDHVNAARLGGRGPAVRWVGTEELALEGGASGSGDPA